jgi:dUTPase
MKKVAIGFQGGGGIAVRVEDDSLAQLRDALKAGDAWIDLETADGKVTLKTGEVVYVSTDSGEHKVGFRGLG